MNVAWSVVWNVGGRPCDTCGLRLPVQVLVERGRFVSGESSLWRLCGVPRRVAIPEMHGVVPVVIRPRLRCRLRARGRDWALGVRLGPYAPTPESPLWLLAGAESVASGLRRN